MPSEAKPSANITFNVNAEQASRLLHNLATDVDFRTKLKNNPRQVLKDEFNISIAEESVAHLPSMEDVQRVRDAIQRSRGEAGYTTIPLDPCLWWAISAYCAAMNIQKGDRPEETG